MPSLKNQQNGKFPETLSCKKKVGKVIQSLPTCIYILVLLAEIHWEALRRSIEIVGINLPGTEHKVSQYADDMALFIEYDLNSRDPLWPSGYDAWLPGSASAVSPR